MSDRTVKNSQIFTEVQAELSTKLSSALEDLLPLIASDLDEFRENTRDADDKRTLLDASSALRLDSRKRINNFSQDLAENAGRTLVAGLLADADNRKPVLVDGKERSQKSLVEELTGSIRQLRAGDYAEFASQVRAISPKDWDDDDLNPLGARMLASSLASTFQNLTTSPSVNAAVRLSLNSRYTDAVLDVLADCSSRMVRHRVKPAPVPRMDASVPERAGSERKPDGTRQAGGGQRAAPKLVADVRIPNLRLRFWKTTPPASSAHGPNSARKARLVSSPVFRRTRADWVLRRWRVCVKIFVCGRCRITTLCAGWKMTP